MNKNYTIVPYIKGGFIYIAALLCAVVLSFVFAPLWLAIVISLIFLLVVIIDFLRDRSSDKHLKKYFDSLSCDLIKSCVEESPHFPFPSALLSLSGKVMWFNKSLDKLFDGEFLFHRDFVSLVKNFDISAETEDGSFPVIRTKIRERFYDIIANRSDENIFVFFIDVTEAEAAQSLYTDEKAVPVMICFDNYDEIMQGEDEASSSRINSEIWNLLVHSVSSLSGIIKRLEKDKFFVLINNAALENLKAKNFEILEQVHKITSSFALTPTLSIGIGVGGRSLAENNSFAAAALDMALGRGGDQAVIKNNAHLSYFGGQTQETEKRTKVKARVVSHALWELISNASQVIITGHRNADIDCLGACSGIAAISRAHGKKTFIAMEMHDDSVASAREKLCKKPAYDGVFISPAEANEIITNNTLLVVVDTHSLSYMETPSLLSDTEHIVLIDHHRRCSDYIEGAILSYHEPYASSASELVSEMFQYLPSARLLPEEAEVLYAGIYLDTKGFTFKTGVRTLESAAFLRRAGVDPLSAKQLFKNNFNSYMGRTQLVSSAKIYKEHIAISATEAPATQYMVAQAADELLNISEVDTSFVLAVSGDEVVISGRSTGAINVQLILEKLGGGGHMNVAGAQIKASVPEAYDMLCEAIDKYLFK